MERKFSIATSAALSAAVFIFFSALFLFTEKRGNLYLTSKIIYGAFPAIIAFIIFYTGKISGARSFFFITSAVAFIIVFKFKLWGITQNLVLAPQPGKPEVPYCHIAMASTLAGTTMDQLKAVFIYGWDKWGFYTLGVVYVFSTLSIGPAFCSWACFYGGIDEAFSKMAPKQAIKLNAVPRLVRDFPVGFWLFLMLTSIVLLEPVFCLWFCPLKLTTALLNNGELLTYRLQITVFVSIAVIFLVGLPLLTKKRAFCSFICPFGAFQSVCGQVNPFRVVRDEKKCVKCGDCVKTCPMVAITGDLKVLHYCVRCGKCVDGCRENALTISNSQLAIHNFKKNNSKISYAAFILSAIVIGGTVSSFFVPEAMVVLVKAFFR